MSSKEARANFSDIVGSVFYTKEPVVVEKNGKPMAVVISPDDYTRYQKAEKQQLLQTIREIREHNRDKDPEEIEADIAAAVEEVRQEEYDERKRATS
jgi:prevent-host-death family protein